MSAIERLTVMFAGITGEEALIEAVGAQAALPRSQRILDHMADLTRENEGEIIEFVPATMLAVFNSPDAALTAGCKMLHDLHQSGPWQDPDLNLTIGMHFGVVYRKNDNIFGDAVNTAARIKSEARPGQLLLSREVRNEMHEESTKLLNTYDRLKVKGKAEELTIYEAIWQPEDMNRTTIFEAMVSTGYLKDLAAEHLELSIGDEVRTLTAQMMPVGLGRGHGNDIPVDSPRASRNHCKIEHRRGKFVLVDESTNGTHLVRSDGSAALLKREEAVLTGEGRFCLGEPARSDAEWVIRFKCE